MSEQLAIGIDVGASNTKVGLVNSQGRILDHHILPSQLQEQDSAGRFLSAPFLTAVGAVVEQYLSKSPAVRGIGISLCSIINEDHTGVLLAVNAPALSGLNIQQAFTSRFGCPVQVSNDVASYAMAEYHFGAGKGFKRLLCLALGTGLAIAALVNGQLIETWGGISADAGRIILDPDSEIRCKAGVHGSAEALCGVANIERLARIAYQRENADASSVTAREVIESSQAERDVRACQVMAEIGGHVGHLAAILSPIFFPQRILVTGGTAEGGEPLFRAIRQRYASLIGDYMTTLSELETGQAEPIEILKAELGPEAAIIGSALSFLQA